MSYTPGFPAARTFWCAVAVPASLDLLCGADGRTLPARRGFRQISKTRGSFQQHRQVWSLLRDAARRGQSRGGNAALPRTPRHTKRRGCPAVGDASTWSTLTKMPGACVLFCARTGARPSDRPEQRVYRSTRAHLGADLLVGPPSQRHPTHRHASRGGACGVAGRAWASGCPEQCFQVQNAFEPLFLRCVLTKVSTQGAATVAALPEGLWAAFGEKVPLCLSAEKRFNRGPYFPFFGGRYFPFWGGPFCLTFFV